MNIEALAREADFTEQQSKHGIKVWLATDSDITRFAALIRAQALDDAAAAINAEADLWRGQEDVSNFRLAAAAVRALKDKP